MKIPNSPFVMILYSRCRQLVISLLNGTITVFLTIQHINGRRTKMYKIYKNSSLFYFIYLYIYIYFGCFQAVLEIGFVFGKVCWLFFCFIKTQLSFSFDHGSSGNYVTINKLKLMINHWYNLMCVMLGTTEGWLWELRRIDCLWNSSFYAPNTTNSY